MRKMRPGLCVRESNDIGRVKVHCWTSPKPSTVYESPLEKLIPLLYLKMKILIGVTVGFSLTCVQTCTPFYHVFPVLFFGKSSVFLLTTSSTSKSYRFAQHPSVIKLTLISLLCWWSIFSGLPCLALSSFILYSWTILYQGTKDQN